ncbi:MAG: L-threonylcarbamoyladenylate synthase [Actinomycetaceae bacterium]|nr:L-threonylcarbamoyladenylate synthase [Actinomycetaceae bacterium]
MTYLEMHPVNPQVRFVNRTVELLRDGGVIAMPTDSGYAICTSMGNKEGMETIRRIRDLDEKHNFSFLCHNFSQLGNLVIVDNKAFRTIKALTPGPYTFILRGTKEIPRRTLNKKKQTVGVRIPEHTITQAIVAELGEPLMCSTLILPGESEAMWDGQAVNEAIGHEVDLVIAGPVGNAGATTVVDFTEGYPQVVREGAGSTELF